jgi:hypothetical protein
MTTVTTSTTVPTTGSFWVMHHECHNDGIKIKIHAERTPIGGVAVANRELTVSVLDSADAVLYEITGSLDPLAKDDYGQSIYLPDVAASVTGGAVEIGVVDPEAEVPTDSDAYGDSTFTSGLLQCFTEGGTTYTSDDYTRCVNALRNTNIPYGYLISGGTQVLDLLGKLGALGIEANVPVKIDLPGTLTPAAAIAMAQSLNFDSHLIHFYWAPLEANDPMNGVRAVWGTGGLNAGYSCARNARVNAKGFAPKNFPVAGKEWPINRTAIKQLYAPSEQELSDLAKSQVNPVLFQNYNGGGRYVFTDSLTSARVSKSYIKLISVAEMSATLDNIVSMYASELVQLPMATFRRRMEAFLEDLLTGAEASGWLVPAKNLPGNAAFAYTVRPSEVRPADLVLIDYQVSYDGVARQVIVQQTLTR